MAASYTPQGAMQKYVPAVIVAACRGTRSVNNQPDYCSLHLCCIGVVYMAAASDQRLYKKNAKVFLLPAFSAILDLLPTATLFKTSYTASKAQRLGLSNVIAA